MRRIRAYGLLMAFILLLGSGALAQNVGGPGVGGPGVDAQNVDLEAAAQAPLKFYQAVNAKDYAIAWGLLTEASKTRLSILVAEEAKLQPADVRKLFDATDDSVRDGFWESFRGSAKPDLYVGFAYKYTGDKDGGHVVQASDPGAENGQTLDMFVKNEGGYKFGLVETYGI